MTPGESSISTTARYLPHMLIATAAVTLIPIAAIWAMRIRGLSSSPWVCIPLAVAISLAISALGSAYWKRRRPAPELLFSDLMLWTWLRRRRHERTIKDARELLEHANALNPERREQLLRKLAVSLDAQDPYTIGHSRRVARHSGMVARKLGLSSEETRKIRTAGAVHDIGKLYVTSRLLNKPGPLSDSEYELVKQHVDDGAEQVSVLGDPELTSVVRHHHERMDGSGYPAGLSGEQIPLGARIIAVTDTFDAITSARAYRPARTHKEALEILRAESGLQLDGRVVEAFIACYAGRRAVAAWAALSTLPQTALNAFGGSTRSTREVRSWPVQAVSTGATMAAIAALAVAAPIAPHHRRSEQPPPAGAAVAAAPIVHGSSATAANRRQAVVASRRATAPSPTIASFPVATPPTSQVHTQFALAPALAPTTSRRVPTSPGRAARSTPATPRPSRRTTGTTTTTSTSASASSPHPTTGTSPATVQTPAAPHVPSATTTATTPPPTTTTVSSAPSTTSVSTTSPTPTTTETTSTTTTTTSPDRDPCKDGGWVPLAYSNQGRCESARHRH